MKPSAQQFPLDSEGLNTAAIAAIQNKIDEQKTHRAHFQDMFDFIERKRCNGRYTAKQPVVVLLSFCSNMHLNLSYKIQDAADWTLDNKRVYQVIPYHFEKSEKETAANELVELMKKSHDDRMEALFQAWVFGSKENKKVHDRFHRLLSNIQNKVASDRSSQRDEYKRADAFVIQLGEECFFVSKAEIKEYANLLREMRSVVSKRENAGRNTRGEFFVAAGVIGLGVPFASFCALSLFASREVFNAALPVFGDAMIGVAALALVLLVAGMIARCVQKAAAPHRFPFPGSVSMWRSQAQQSHGVIDERVQHTAVVVGESSSLAI